MLFTSFMMGEMAASTLFRGMSSGTRHPVFSEMFQRIGRDESPASPDLHDDPGERVARAHRRRPLAHHPAAAGRVRVPVDDPLGAAEGFWELPPYFLDNHRVLMDHAREAGLGVLSYEEQAENWRVAMARIRAIVERWGIEFPAIPELDIEGVHVDFLDPEEIIPVF
ncbi:hypothetical protein [Nonomuraea dietziae]|uniref:hypothetical protein n=1 Tax=Nonomuraea dietziae TaxID=65515 RepID=UPI0031CE7318